MSSLQALVLPLPDATSPTSDSTFQSIWEPDERAWPQGQRSGGDSTWNNRAWTLDICLSQSNVTDGDTWSVLSPTLHNLSPFLGHGTAVQNCPLTPDMWQVHNSAECTTVLSYDPVSRCDDQADEAAVLPQDSPTFCTAVETTATIVLEGPDDVHTNDPTVRVGDCASLLADAKSRARRKTAHHKHLYEALTSNTGFPVPTSVATTNESRNYRHVDEELGEELSRHVLQLLDATPRIRNPPIACGGGVYDPPQGRMTEAQRRLGCFSPSTPPASQRMLFTQSSYASSSEIDSFRLSPLPFGATPPRKMESVDHFRAHLYAMYQIDKLPIDGWYHCPFRVECSCEHEPSRSRGDCEQYIDSHVKPYRCTFTGCTVLKFSSLACRLRHEKEAHCAHGHGVRPFHCLYPECERSLPGHGFPRHWNRNDHMKRVHGHSDTKRRVTEEAEYVDPSTLAYMALARGYNEVVEKEELCAVPAKRRRKA